MMPLTTAAAKGASPQTTPAITRARVLTRALSTTQKITGHQDSGTVTKAIAAAYAATDHFAVPTPRITAAMAGAMTSGGTMSRAPGVLGSTGDRVSRPGDETPVADSTPD